MSVKENSETAALIREYIGYCPKTGKFWWKKRPAQCRAVGDIAGHNSRGYWRILFRGRFHYGHRIAFLLMEGRWPSEQIDHINRNKSDNRWCNLREASPSLNAVNRVRSRPNGLPRGVYHAGRKFSVKIQRNGVSRYLGCFASIEQATAEYDRAAAQWFTGDGPAPLALPERPGA